MNNSVFVHPTVIMDKGAHIGAETKIWHFCHLMPGCTVGGTFTIGQNVFIDNNVIVGNHVKIQNNVSIYNGVIIEDDVFIGPSVFFTNVINPRSFIERKQEFKPIIIRKGATIGANATIVCGNEVGEYAMVGAGSVVTKNIKSYALVYGHPAPQQGWVSKAGMELQFNEGGKAVCSHTGEGYILKNEQVQMEA